MHAREKESQRQMKENARVKKAIPVSPDLANFWTLKSVATPEENGVGISISYQIIRQWRGVEKYTDCMANLIKHIIVKTGRKVLLIPNEITAWNNYHDMHVARDIYSLLNYSKS